MTMADQNSGQRGPNQLSGAMGSLAILMWRWFPCTLETLHMGTYHCMFTTPQEIYLKHN